MTHPVDILLVLVILLNFLVLGTPALRMTIRAAAVQGAILAALPLLVHRGFGWRVAAIAVVHESLSADAGECVDFDEVVDRIVALVRDLAPAYAGGGPTPGISREGSWGSLPADLATPLAMTVSELLHNAVEHAAAATVVRISSVISRSWAPSKVFSARKTLTSSTSLLRSGSGWLWRCRRA